MRASGAHTKNLSPKGLGVIMAKLPRCKCASAVGKEQTRKAREAAQRKDSAKQRATEKKERAAWRKRKAVRKYYSALRRELIKSREAA